LELVVIVKDITYTEQHIHHCGWLLGIRTIESEETTARSSLIAAEKQIEHLTVVSPRLYRYLCYKSVE